MSLLTPDADSTAQSDGSPRPRADFTWAVAFLVLLLVTEGCNTYYLGESAVSGNPVSAPLLWVAAIASTLATIVTLALAGHYRGLARAFAANDKAQRILSESSMAVLEANQDLAEKMAQGHRELSEQTQALIRSEHRHERLQEFSEGLEGSVKSRTHELERRTAQLESANRDLESFTYSVSHDLRAPLRAINGFAEILVARHADDLDEQGQHFLSNIVQASVNMGMLIDDLLKYCRLGRSAVNLRDIDTQLLMEQVLANFAVRISALGARVDVTPILPTVRSDATLLGQIFGNYIDNALTYGREGIPPRIVVSAQFADASWTYAFADDGIGISPDQLEKIFEPFQRLHSYEQYPGTGIGLALVRKAAQMLDGSAWAESIPGSGSKFFFCLPIGPPVPNEYQLREQSHE
jgi:light-regulated signal transduction histidine kinase (bacteriophytochrome)